MRPLPDYEELRQIIHDKTKVVNMLEKALAEDRRKGFEQGMAQGRVEGKVEGRAEERAKNAQKLLERGIALEDIMYCTGMSEADLLKLQDEMTKH